MESDDGLVSQRKHRRMGSRKHSVLSVALDDACRRADEAGLTVDRFGEAARDVLARRIIMLAKHGVLEHQRLVDDALRGLQR